MSMIEDDLGKQIDRSVVTWLKISTGQRMLSKQEY